MRRNSPAFWRKSCANCDASGRGWALVWGGAGRGGGAGGRGWIVRGWGEGGAGMDDVSVSGATTMAELNNDKITSAILDVSWLGIPRVSVAELRGGNAKENAATIYGILSGKITGAKRDMTIVNAAAGFVVAGLAKDLRAGLGLAREELDS